MGLEGRRIYTEDGTPVTTSNPLPVTGSITSEDSAIKYLTFIDEATTTTTYLGLALPGTGETTTGWQIRQIYASGTVTQIAFAGGTSGFDFIWATRTSYSYS